MSITFVGLNHRTASVDMRERVAFPEHDLPKALKALIAVPGVEEAVILSTCNRTEIYASVDDKCDGLDLLSNFICTYHDVPSRELLPNLYTADELDAVTHLFNVVCSLDSLVLGEQQILAQVRKAYSVATENNTTGKVLNQMFHQALSVGKGVRSETEISKSHVSMSTVAVDLAKRVFGDLDKRTVLVLGAGEMSELTATYLAENGVGCILVANRTYDHALALANELDARAIRFDDLEDALRDADIVISSTAAPCYVLGPDEVRRARKRKRGQSLLLIDIALPRDIDPACADIEDVFVYDIDDLQGIVKENQAGRQLAAKDAARMVGAEVREFADWMEVCDATPTIAQLRTHADAIRDEELARLFKRLKNVDDADRQSIEAAMNAMNNKLLHKPMKVLRDSASTADGPRYVRAVRDLFGLDDEDER